jgi:hypothetical protein
VRGAKAAMAETGGWWVTQLATEFKSLEACPALRWPGTSVCFAFPVAHALPAKLYLRFRALPAVRSPPPLVVSQYALSS